MEGSLFHIYNRGVKKNAIFRSESDYLRFLYSLYRFNNKGGALRGSFDEPLSGWPEQDKIVEVLKWSLLPNHYHLLVLELVENGCAEFVGRLGNGYTKYSNIKYEESGYLFQNEAKRTLIENDGQYLYVPYYVELNPLDVKFPGWKRSCIADIESGVDFVKKYKWSSLRNYIGISDEFEEVVSKDAFYDLYDLSPEHYEEELGDWIKNIPEMETFGARKLI